MTRFQPNPAYRGFGRRLQLLAKHTTDRLVALVLLVLLSPLLALIALAIKLDDRGSVFFTQLRPGRHTVPFRIWKFRTMVENADDLLEDSGGVAKPRVTRVGALLRSWSLDELPQLFNLLGGSMSLVGPRPALMESVQRYDQDQMERFNMKPGVTGLAQVNGRNQLLWSRRLAYDAQYARNYSLWLDVKILAKTLPVVLRREGFVLDRNPEQVDDL